MLLAGCDIGSLTAKAVLLDLDTGKIISQGILPVRPTAVESSFAIMNIVLNRVGLSHDDIDYLCSTGYGRLEIPFADMHISEISCHGRGAHWLDTSIRTVVDIGGQDCKVISIDNAGFINDFIMNDKCAAGTGRSLEMLAATIGVPLDDLGRLSLKSRKPVPISNKCSIFMELEVLDAMYRKKKLKHIAHGLTDAVAKRVASLAKAVPVRESICITGGVAKNMGVVRQLEKYMDIHFKKLPVDSQLIGAIGAALFAGDTYTKKGVPSEAKC
ncbi:MAG TPA: acyl-CoA dehydratase activase [Spirochaetota bacterium]|nr:acyl-CoA dehydratase activase [Spirochaetota bacterium]